MQIRKFFTAPRILFAMLMLGLLAASSSAPVIAAGPPESTVLYVVQYGDTLDSIAARFGVTVEAILQANGLTLNYMYVGQQMSVPSGYGYNGAYAGQKVNFDFGKNIGEEAGTGVNASTSEPSGRIWTW